MKKIVRTVLAPVYRFLSRPKTRYTLLPVVNQLFSYNRRDQIYMDVMGFANFSDLKGDYLEFGTWKGGSLITAYYISRWFPNLKSMRFFGFDSFEGLPEKKGIDATSSDFKEGEYATTMPDLLKNLKKAGVDTTRVHLTPGWFDKSLSEKTKQSLGIDRAAIILVDCDLYESTVPVLTFITPFVVDGTVIIFDDWFCFRADQNKGEQRAFREWLERNPHITVTAYHTYGWQGNSFILHTKRT